MENEKEISSEIRLWALECFVVQSAAMFFHTSGNAAEAFETRRKLLLDNARQTAFPGLDPATSDLYAAELQSALERLLEMQRQQG